MEHKRAFLRRCNTAIVRSRAQLIGYRESLCKSEKGPPLGAAVPWVRNWAGRTRAESELSLSRWLDAFVQQQPRLLLGE